MRRRDSRDGKYLPNTPPDAGERCDDDRRPRERVECIGHERPGAHHCAHARIERDRDRRGDGGSREARLRAYVAQPLSRTSATTRAVAKAIQTATSPTHAAAIPDCARSAAASQTAYAKVTTLPASSTA